MRVKIGSKPVARTCFTLLTWDVIVRHLTALVWCGDKVVTVYVLTNSDDVFKEVSGSGPDDLIRGLAGNDVIYSDFGTDKILAGVGDDTVYASHAGTFLGQDGNDVIYLDMFGTAALHGVSSVNGGEGSDIFGLALRDRGTTHDSVTVIATDGGWTLDLDGRTLAKATQVETLDINLEEIRATACSIMGGTGNDHVRFGTGDTAFFGGAGDDLVILNDPDGVLTLDGGDGDDTLYIYGFTTRGGAITLDLRDGGSTLMIGEKQGSLTGFEHLNLMGTQHDDVAYLGAGNDIITEDDPQSREIGGKDFYSTGGGTDYVSAGIGDDTVIGGDGRDTILGGAGHNEVTGGRGGDRLQAGGGANVFGYLHVTDSSVGGAGMDRIVRFSGPGGGGGADRIDLSAIDAMTGAGAANDAFVFVGTEAFSGAGQVRLIEAGGGVFVDINTLGGIGPDMEIFLTGISAASLDVTSFYL